MKIDGLKTYISAGTTAAIAVIATVGLVAGKIDRETWATVMATIGVVGGSAAAAALRHGVEKARPRRRRKSQQAK